MDDRQQYWERRLRDHAGLAGVGYLGKGRRYNQWMYRVKGAVLARAVHALGLDLGAMNVLDIGSGTGFFVDKWQQLGAKTVVGTDIAAVAVENLRKQFPGGEFFQLDIGGDLPPGQREYDLVSAFDVLYHIVDDRRFQCAIANIHALLRSGGWFVFTESFVHTGAQRSEHQVSRPLAEIEQLLRETGFQSVYRKPMFVLMNFPVDASAAFWKWLWRVVTFPAGKVEALGFLLGGLLYPFELFLTARLAEGPSTEIMACRKTG